MVGGHGLSQHPPYNPAMAVYADLIRYRELFASLFQRDLRAKYKGSVLGLVWSLALPVTLMLVYLVVFSVMWKSPTTDVDNYWLFLLCGLPPWVFFATSLQSSARSLLENASLIRKVRFPRQLVPLSIVATQLVAFAVMTGIVLVLAMIVLPDSRSTAWLVIPIAAVIVALRLGALARRRSRRTRSTATSSSSSPRCCCRCSSSRRSSTASTSSPVRQTTRG